MMINPLDFISRFNFKNFNVDQLRQNLIGNKNAVLKTMAIVITVIALGALLNNYRKEEAQLSSQMSQMQEKIGVITAYEGGLKILNSFTSSFPKGLKEDKVISQIIDYAAAHHVKIVSITGGQRANNGPYDLSKVHFIASSKEYKDMILFLRAIETSPYALRVESWTRVVHEPQELRCEIEISLMRFNL